MVRSKTKCGSFQTIWMPCVCTHTVPNIQWLRLDPKTCKCLMLGYKIGTKAYWLWDSKCHCIVKSWEFFDKWTGSALNVEIQHDLSTIVWSGVTIVTPCQLWTSSPTLDPLTSNSVTLLMPFSTDSVLEFQPCVRVLPEFPLLVPFIVLLSLSVSALTNQAPMISIKGGTGIVFVLSLISKDIHCTRQVFVFMSGCYKLRISAIPGGHYVLLAPVFE